MQRVSGEIHLYLHSGCSHFVQIPVILVIYVAFVSEGFTKAKQKKEYNGLINLLCEFWL